MFWHSVLSQMLQSFFNRVKHQLLCLGCDRRTAAKTMDTSAKNVNSFPSKVHDNSTAIEQLCTFTHLMQMVQRNSVKKSCCLNDLQ